ncbi:hypothetical protein EPN54_01920 [bacterium]|nr:MAG: hypothetical protein EPN54_01920 [bacterium]
MKNTRIAVIAAAFVLSLGLTGFAGTLSFTLDAGAYNSVPEPRLRYPIYDTVTLTGNAPLEFKWWNSYVGVHGFIFKLYKGYNMYAADLIRKEELPAGAYSIKISPELFEDGRVYTWSLVQVSSAGYKSDRSFNSFKVIKK